MRKNRRRSRKMSVVTGYTVRFGVVMLVLIVMAGVNLAADSTCSHLSRMIGAQERELKRLDEDLLRESARWEAMKSDENIERKLLKHGLKMDYAHPEQIVRMKSDLTPYESQLSIVHARQGSAGGSLAASRTRKRR